MNDLHLDELKLENERLSAVNGILLDTAKNQESLIKHFRKMLIAITVSFTIIICCMVGGFFYYESQFETVETTTTTTDMNTSGDNADINNVTNGDMYNDNATHNE
nr:MAG TPA: hypothetical protein [Caudoviricetes sp.]